MAKLARSSIESYQVGDGKAGCVAPSLLPYIVSSCVQVTADPVHAQTNARSSYVSSWLSLLRTHEVLGDNRVKFASQLSDMADELAVLGKEVDKSRKATKDLGARLEKGLQEQEGLVDKVRSSPFSTSSSFSAVS